MGRRKAKAFPARPPETATVRTRFPVWLGALLLALATAIAYQPAWHAGFIWDDDFYVTGNRLLASSDGLERIWFSFDSPSQYFPLVYTVFRLEHMLWGIDADGYHWVNILLHVVNALLVWRLLERLTVPGAWLAAAIFALHPVQVESVAWVTELKNVLMLFFFLLTLLAWVTFIEEGTRRRYRYYVLALVLYALALSAKTTACTLPIALLLILWLKRQPITGRRLWQVVPFVVWGMGMGLLTIWWERFHQGTQGKPFAMDWLERILVASRAVWFYAGKLAWPANLTFSYPRWTISPTDPLAYGWLLALAVLGAVLWLQWRRVGRSVGVAVVFFVATLGPVLGFIMLYTFLYSFVADHYQYVACIGLVALFSAGLMKLIGRMKPGRRWLGTAACLGLLALLWVLTWRQARIYADEETLWQDTIAKNPASWMAHNNLGNYLNKNGRSDKAISHYQAALQLHPDDGEIENNLGTALYKEGRTEEAISQFQEAVRAEPDYAKAHYNLGLALGRRGDVEGAIEQLQETIRLKPRYAPAYNDLGTALYQRGRVEEAIGQFRQAIRLKPDYVAAYNNLGTVLSANGQLDEAARQFEEAIRLEPDNAGAHFGLGNTLYKQGQVDAAIGQFREAVRLNPDFATARDNLARALAKKGGQ